MNKAATRVLIAPVLVLGVAIGAGACSVDIPVDDESAAASTRPTAPPGPDASVDPSATAGVNSRSEGGVTEAVPTGYVLPQDIEPGTCYLRLPDTYDLSDAIEVDCSEPHFVEVLTTFTWPSAYADVIPEEHGNQVSRCGSYLDTAAKDGGYERMDYSPRGDVESSTTVYAPADNVWFPSAAQLVAGDGVGYCTIVPVFDEELLSGSLVAGTYQGYAKL